MTESVSFSCPIVSNHKILNTFHSHTDYEHSFFNFGEVDMFKIFQLVNKTSVICNNVGLDPR